MNCPKFGKIWPICHSVAKVPLLCHVSVQNLPNLAKTQPNRPSLYVVCRHTFNYLKWYDNGL